MEKERPQRVPAYACIRMWSTVNHSHAIMEYAANTGPGFGSASQPKALLPYMLRIPPPNGWIFCETVFGIDGSVDKKSTANVTRASRPPSVVQERPITRCDFSIFGEKVAGKLRVPAAQTQQNAPFTRRTTAHGVCLLLWRQRPRFLLATLSSGPLRLRLFLWFRLFHLCL